MRRSERPLSREIEEAMGIAAEEMLRRACTDGEIMEAVRLAVEEGDYRVLARVVRNSDCIYPKEAREEAARLTGVAIRNAISFAAGGRETRDVLRLAEIMDARGIPTELRVEAWLGLKYLLRNNSEAVLAQIEHAERQEMKKKHREFALKKRAERPPQAKVPR